MSIANIKYRGVEVEVEYTPHRAHNGHGMEPDEPAHITVDAVLWNGHDVMELLEDLDDSAIDEITEKVEDYDDGARTEALLAMSGAY